MANIDFPEGYFPEGFQLPSARDFAEFEEVGKVRLCQDECAQLIEIMETYTLDKRRRYEYPTKDERKMLLKLSVSAGEAAELIGTIQKNKWLDLLSFRKIGIDPDLLNLQLSRIATRARNLHEGFKKVSGPKGRRPDSALEHCLFMLSGVFIEAGGDLTITHDPINDKLKAPFIHFAWAVLQRVPKDVRPNRSPEALAAIWERFNRVGNSAE